MSGTTKPTGYPQELGIQHLNDMLLVLGNGKLRAVKKGDKEILKKHLKNGRAYGWWVGAEVLEKFNPQLIAYCIIKNADSDHPETMTQVHKSYRNMGYATYIRNYALAQREFRGNIVYSAVRTDNPASLRSVLKSGFQVFDVTRDGFIQLVRVLPYERPEKQSR